MIANNLGLYSSSKGAAEDGGSAEAQEKTDLIVTRCYPCGPSIYFSNNNDTRVVNNAGKISAQGQVYVEPSWLVPPHPYMHHNYNGYLMGPVAGLLRDADNRDFRPRAGTSLVDAGAVLPGVTDGFRGSAPDIGAYEYSPPATDVAYWIPGAKLSKASRPVPTDGTTSAMPDLDLMYLGAYEATTHDVLFGLSVVALRPICRHHGAANICSPPRPLLTGITYYWRVDADGLVGDVWSFQLLDRALQVLEAQADSYWQLSHPDTPRLAVGVRSTQVYSRYAYL